MSLPGQSYTLQDPGMANVIPGTKIPMVIGCCSSGTANVVKTYNSIASLLTTEGRGPAVNCAARLLQWCGGPVRFCKITQDAAGTMTATLTNSGGGPAITNASSTPYEPFDVVFKVKTGGAIGTARLQYSLDGGRTYSNPIVSAATYSITGTGLSFAMATGTDFVTDATYTGVATAPTYTTGGLSSAVTAITASPVAWDYLVLTGVHSSAGVANTIAGALDGHLTSWFNAFRFTGAIMDAGSDDAAADIATSYTQTSKRIMPCAGWLDTVTPLPLAGFSCPATPVYEHAAMRAAEAAISSDLGRVKDGPLHAAQDPSTSWPSPYSIDSADWATIDDEGIAVARTFPWVSGWYLARGRINPPFGSDYTDWNRLVIMNEAMKVVYQQQALMQNRTFSTNADGTIDEAEAAAAEAIVQTALDVRFKDERNAEGTKGHVSDIKYTIDREYDVGSTQYVNTELAIRPRTTARWISTSCGYKQG